MSTSSRSLPAIDFSRLATSDTYNLTTLFASLEKLVDFLAVVAAVYAASTLYRFFEPQRAGLLGWSAVLWAAAFALLFVFLLERHGGYRRSVSLLAIRETERILRVTLHGLLLAVLAAYFFA